MLLAKQHQPEEHMSRFNFLPSLVMSPLREAGRVEGFPRSSARVTCSVFIRLHGPVSAIAYMARSARTVSSAWLRRDCNSMSISRRHLRIKLPIEGVINSKPKGGIRCSIHISSRGVYCTFIFIYKAHCKVASTKLSLGIPSLLGVASGYGCVC